MAGYRVLVLAFLSVWLLQAATWPAELPKPIFYLPLDGSTSATLAGGPRAPRIAGQADTILALIDLQRSSFGPGKVGRGYDVQDSPLVFPCAGNFRADEGTCSFWICPHFSGADPSMYAAFFGAADWGMLYKYEDQSSLTFGTAKPEGDLYYDCGARDISAWRPDEWHHVVVNWSRAGNARRIYIDGKLEASAPFPYHREVPEGSLFIGSSCALYPGYTAHARLDEVAIWDQPLSEGSVRELFTLGGAGKPLWSAEVTPMPPAGSQTERLNLVHPDAPKIPEATPAAAQRIATRQTIPLNGWWHFLPAVEALTELPAEGWGWTRVPGYWTDREGTVGPDGQPAGGSWGGRPMSQFTTGYLQRTFEADPDWKAREVFLHFDGVDGLAEVYLNGKRVGRLPSWEYEDYDVGPRLRYGEENTLTLVLHPQGGTRESGTYGGVSLRVLPKAFVNDIVVWPLLAKGQIGFSCDVWHTGAPSEAQLELEVAPSSSQEAVKRFEVLCRLQGADRGRAELSAQAQRVESSFDWKDAHLWTYDDPFLYQVRARLRLRGAVVDETPWQRFGFREFTRLGSDFFLNGKPTHLRGHQIDLGWSNQMARVKELKGAGMNAFELSGPISSDWYGGSPYQDQLFEQVLDYADEHGLIALPLLPDARVLRDRIFDPEVAQLYRRRVEKHIRRYGNHASIGMWFMHFNLAGYDWCMAPDKIDGSYKPSDTAFLARERYALEAQRIAQTVDPRPIYHHACGNFGDIFTVNCYIGPDSPLQEREEWPSRWAEKRPFPLIACEHCLMLIPYWFRERRFPLDDVYASEPIFDEIAAMYEGRRAYGSLTPQLFDLYDMGQEPRGSRTQALIENHPGYQEVKTIFARRSLRAWRTYGVSGIIFNAENWDFKDANGSELPVMKAMARYFGDTDLYIAGPAGDWESKDHSFVSGERVRKQIVLLNDLTRDLPCKLEWRLVDAKGKVSASGKVDAVSRAGQPTFAPVEFAAPKVTARTGFTLVVSAVSQPGQHFQPESLALQVYPLAPRPLVRGKVLLFDTEGQTTAALTRAGIPFQPLTEASDPSSAALVIVGRKSYTHAFLALSRKLDLERAVRSGLHLLVFEQTAGSPLGLKLEEQSTRQAFIAAPGHPFLRGLAPEDLVDFRGRSDLMVAYPPAAPETEREWPTRFFKWGNRGVVATYVCAKPHYAPFTPVLECGFDLVDSPLMEARLGAGRAVVCQLDVTSRCGIDPVATRLVQNLVGELTRRADAGARPCAFLGESAKEFARPFGIVPEAFDPQRSNLVFVGAEPLSPEQIAGIEAVARRGATVLLLPGVSSAGALGLQTKETRVFIGRMGSSPLLAGLGDDDLYLKGWTTVAAALPGNGWESIVAPGLVSVKEVGKGMLVACQVDPGKLGASRGRVKALRFWNILLANLGARRTGFDAFLEPEGSLYEENRWEHIPPYIDW